MRKLLLVSATEFELQPTLHFLEPYRTNLQNNFNYEGLQIDVCITGVGMVNTALLLGELKNNLYDYAVNAGVAGSFIDLGLGQVVTVNSDSFSELGAEDGEEFITIDSLGFGAQKIVLEKKIDSIVLEALLSVSSITVNKVHGNEISIEKIRVSHQPEIESMEGAAFFLAAKKYNWKAAQLRAISNKVEKRNRSHWDLPLAIKNLNNVLVELIKELRHN